MQDILGQPNATQTLQKQLVSGRLHHSYLFHGPRGVGKFTTAVAFARVLLCPNAQPDLSGEVTACGDCESCRLIPGVPDASARQASPQRRREEEKEGGEEADGGGLSIPHPDLHVVTKELARYSDDATVRGRKLTSIPIEVVRQALVEPAYRRPQMHSGKVFILDEAELLNNYSQNAVLKTLEEPPAGTYFILVTSSEDRLLPTIRSRCQRVAFVPLPEAAVQHWVDKHATHLTENQRRWLVKFAEGSLGRAEMAVAYELHEWAVALLPAVDAMAKRKVVLPLLDSREKTDKKTGRPAQLTLGEAMHERIEAFANEWVKRHDGASKEAANALGTGLIAALIGTYARRRLAEFASSCDPADPVGGDAVMRPWLGVIQAVEQTQQLQAAHVHLGLVCDHLGVELYRALAGGSVT